MRNACCIEWVLVFCFFFSAGLGAALRPAGDESHRNNQNSREHLMQNLVEVWGSEEIEKLG